jgi:hypothetical protein
MRRLWTVAARMYDFPRHELQVIAMTDADILKLVLSIETDCCSERFLISATPLLMWIM